MKRFILSTVLILLTIPPTVPMVKARAVVYRKDFIDCCHGAGWEVRDYNDDGSYTSVNLCDGGAVC